MSEDPSHKRSAPKWLTPRSESVEEFAIFVVSLAARVIGGGAALYYTWKFALTADPSEAPWPLLPSLLGK